MTYKKRTNVFIGLCVVFLLVISVIGVSIRPCKLHDVKEENIKLRNILDISKKENIKLRNILDISKKENIKFRKIVNVLKKENIELRGILNILEEDKVVIIPEATIEYV